MPNILGRGVGGGISPYCLEFGDTKRESHSKVPHIGSLDTGGQPDLNPVAQSRAGAG